jgi:hypothetical protein
MLMKLNMLLILSNVFIYTSTVLSCCRGNSQTFELVPTTDSPGSSPSISRTSYTLRKPPTTKWDTLFTLGKFTAGTLIVAGATAAGVYFGALPYLPYLEDIAQIKETIQHCPEAHKCFVDALMKCNSSP